LYKDEKNDLLIGIVVKIKIIVFSKLSFVVNWQIKNEPVCPLLYAEISDG
jgi:hypothetical protein